MSFKILVLFIQVLLISQQALTQSKFEKEYRIKDGEIPKNAMNFIDSTEIPGKIKWYREESQDGTTVEAKFLYLKSRHSVEFDTSGQILDIEVEKPLSDLEPDLQSNITRSLDSVFSKYKIRKIQAQWTGNRQDHLQRLRSQQSVKGTAPRYEIVVKGKKEGRSRFYEVQLEANGSVVSLLPIVFRSADNLDF